MHPGSHLEGTADRSTPGATVWLVQSYDTVTDESPDQADRVAPPHLQGSRYEMLETRKDGIKFTSEALRQAATQLQTFSGQYESRQGHLVEQVTLGAHSSRPELQHCHGDQPIQSS